MENRFTEEDRYTFNEDNTVTVDLENRVGVNSFELDPARTSEELVASLRKFADEIEATVR